MNLFYSITSLHEWVSRTVYLQSKTTKITIPTMSNINLPSYSLTCLLTYKQVADLRHGNRRYLKSSLRPVTTTMEGQDRGR